jgi:phosphatidylglycerophosphatase A
MKKFIVKMFATGFWSGYFLITPGTFGSIPPLLIAFYLIQNNQPLLIAAAVLATAVSVWSAGEAEKVFGHDARKIVIDEWAGMFITLLFLPYSLTNYAIAFFVFRALDVIKILPARRSEQLPRGWGVTMDDVVAGIQSNLVTQLIIWLINR